MVAKTEKAVKNIIQETVAKASLIDKNFILVVYTKNGAKIPVKVGSDGTLYTAKIEEDPFVMEPSAIIENVKNLFKKAESENIEVVFAEDSISHIFIHRS